MNLHALCLWMVNIQIEPTVLLVSNCNRDFEINFQRSGERGQGGFGTRCVQGRPLVSFICQKPWYIVYYVSTSEKYLYVLWKQQYPPIISRLTLTAESSGDSKDQLKTCKQTHTFSQRCNSLLDCFFQTVVESGVVFLAPLEVLRCKNRQKLTY